jgi:hypothetical protein
MGIFLYLLFVLQLGVISMVYEKGKNFNEISPTSSDFQIQVDSSWSKIGTASAMPTIFCNAPAMRPAWSTLCLIAVEGTFSRSLMSQDPGIWQRNKNEVAQVGR